MDANFGFTAGVAEMLLQSYGGIIQLLPALPGEWSKGSIEGLCARGGFEVNMNWTNGILETASVLSKLGQECVLLTKDEIVVKNTKTEVTKITVNNRLYYQTTFNTESGKTYKIESK